MSCLGEKFMFCHIGVDWNKKLFENWRELHHNLAHVNYIMLTRFCDRPTGIASKFSLELQNLLGTHCISQQYGPTSQQYESIRQQYAPSRQQYGSISQQYGPTRQQYGYISQQYGPTRPKYGSISQQYGSIREASLFMRWGAVYYTANRYISRKCPYLTFIFPKDSEKNHNPKFFAPP